MLRTDRESARYFGPRSCWSSDPALTETMLEHRVAESISTKQCTHCKQVKSYAEFGRHKHCRDGLNTQCKQCNRERVARYQAEKGQEYKAEKHAYDARRWAEGKGRNAEWRRSNTVYLNEKKAEWARLNPEKSKAIKQSYKHRRRAIERDGIGGAELAAWKHAQKKICYWCGIKCGDGFHVDHYTPLSKGGLHEISNLVIACGACNRRKNAKDPLDFAREVGRLL